MGKFRDRKRLLERQSHAFSHLLDAPLRLPIAACPLCLGPFGDGDIQQIDGQAPSVTIEHAPPRQRTRLGAPRAACLTHQACQGAARYESDAGRYRNDLDRLRRGEPASLRGLVDGTDALITLRRNSTRTLSAFVPPGTKSVKLPLTLPVAAQLTELKAAYLIAFSVLGYSWAARPAPETIRSALQSGDAATIGTIPIFMTHDPAAELANTVLIDEQSRRVAVVGDDPRWGVLLPLDEGLPEVTARRSVAMHGYAVPWLADCWWRTQSSRPFRWDCRVTEPVWHLDVEPIVGHGDSPGR